MNRESILTVNSIEDIKNNQEAKYLNINLDNYNKELIDYLIKYGQNYLYSEYINNINGYIYVDYDTFISGEKIISNIISNIPKNLNQIELAKYLYIKLGKTIGYDINTIPNKNEEFNFGKISVINNIWGAITNTKVNNSSCSKLYLYLCRICNIECQIITINTNGFLANKIKIDNNNLIVDLTNDVPFIQGGFKTKYFQDYNDNRQVDKKISYLKNNYTEELIDKAFKKGNIFDFLKKTQEIINIKSVKPVELGIIYDMLFSKYFYNQDIKINNLYINSTEKNHFILISYEDKYYCYNYHKNTFINISKNDIIDNIEKDKIGIYLNENLVLN